MSGFIHLHVHSDYSLLDSAASIPGLIGKAKSLGMSHLAVTDHGNMFGVLNFYKACKESGITPIIGCEFYLAPDSRKIKTSGNQGSKNFHLILLAKNKEGYRNLIRLSSIAYTEGFYYRPRIDRELLEEYHDGLFCLTSCLQGEIPSLLLANQNEQAEKSALYLQRLFGKGNFFIEVQDHGIPDEKAVIPKLIALSRKLDIPPVATNDVHYIDREDANAQDLMICIGTNKKRSESERLKFHGDQFYLKTEEEMRTLFAEIPEAIDNSLEIAKQCSLEIDFIGPQLPDYDIPPQFASPDEYLRHLCYEGLTKRYGERSEEINTRAEYELDIIISMGYTGYFLIVWDFIKYAKEHSIPVGPGRGSGAGSIVAYALQITDIDPLKYGLLFERFLNPERVSMPDFDIDFCYEGRGEVIEYVTRKYGADKVSQIITFGTLKAKAVIRDVARVLDIPYAEADAIAKLVPDTQKMTLKKALELEPRLRELAEKGGVYSELIDTALKLEGLHRHASTHAAGIVIGKSRLTDYVPLYLDAKTKSISTQFTMGLLEDCGLVKMDFLGLKTLTLIKNTLTLLRRRGIDLDLDSISENDEKTYKLLGEGKSTCVFQFESSGMQGILKRAKPSKIEDLIALNALYRPGPMDNIDQFIDSKRGKTPISYPLPILENVLKETYGVIVYQEQVMEIARTVAGYSLGQADILRRIMGKKKPEEMPRLKGEFIQGALNSGYEKKQAEALFELLIPFAGYGFNKSHAAAYSVLAYKTAYLKANYPAEFMAANLTNEISDTSKLTAYMEEAKSMGIGILPPDINISEKYYSVSSGMIIYGLIGIKNVGSSAVDEIIRVRNEDGAFSSIAEFLERVDLKTVNRKVIEMLIQAGCFGTLHKNRAELLNNIERLIETAAAKKASLRYGQTSLFEGEDEPAAAMPEIGESEEWPKDELLRREYEALGFYFSGHPLDGLKEQWRNKVNLNIADAGKSVPDKKYSLIGLLKNLKEIQTKKGDRMAFAELEDFNGSIELVIFPEVFKKYLPYLSNDEIIGIIGTVETRKGSPQIIVGDVKAPEELAEQDVPEVHIRIEGDIDNEEDLYGLRAFLFEQNGDSPVFIHVNGHNGDQESVVRASAQITVAAGGSFMSDIYQYPHVVEVWKQ